MALFIKKYQNKVKKSKAYGKWYGRAVMLGTVEIEELAAEIEEKCTATHSDVLAVLAALGVSIKRKLQESKRVRIPYLGTFKLGVSSAGVIKESDYDVKNDIKGMHVIFQPETTVENKHRVKEMIRGARVAELNKVVNPTGSTGTGSGSGSATDDQGSQGGTTSPDPVEERP